MRIVAAVMVSILAGSLQAAWAAGPTTRPADQIARGKLPFLQIDAEKHQVRMECRAVNAEMALEYLVCVAGTSEHETVFCSRARAAHLHLALIMIGARNGNPAHLDEAGKLVPPSGERLNITCEFVKDGKLVSVPAHRLMRDRKSKAPMPATAWVFAGSYNTAQGDYAADLRGRLISVVNFPDSTIDVPEVRSSSNDELEWEVDPAVAPPRGARVWLIIEKAGK